MTAKISMQRCTITLHLLLSKLVFHKCMTLTAITPLITIKNFFASAKITTIVIIITILERTTTTTIKVINTIACDKVTIYSMISITCKILCVHLSLHQRHCNDINKKHKYSICHCVQYRRANRWMRKILIHSQMLVIAITIFTKKRKIITTHCIIIKRNKCNQGKRVSLI